MEPTGATKATSAQDPLIRPFRYEASDADLADLKRRIHETRWPERETVSYQTQGVQLDTTQKLARYCWSNSAPCTWTWLCACVSTR